jgi:tetratricopeptide (TPR) repeat protein
MAKEMYERAAEINHRMYAANYNLGIIAFIQKDYTAAEKYFENSLYGELEPMAYYQLAKIHLYNGEKDKAITFLNKAIELEPKLQKKAEKEKSFEKIKEYITVSVKMDEKEVQEENVDASENKKSEIMLEQEIKAREYLENTSRIIEEMSENNSKEKIDEKLDLIFNKEKMKSQKELEEREKIKRKEERQRELGNS